MSFTPHGDKLRAALANPKSENDKDVLEEAIDAYEDWIHRLGGLTSSGRERVAEMVRLLNQYKNFLEVDLIMYRGSSFLRRQKGQLKLDNTVLEEFLIHLIHPSILNGLDDLDRLEVGPKNAFMSLAFSPRSLEDLITKPEVFVKTKDQDFVVGTTVHYKLSTTEDFRSQSTESGSFVLAVLAVECKVNLDKTMFQEAAGTATRLKQGCPAARYHVLVEYLDMTPEDCRLTAIDNVWVLRHAKRLPANKRPIPGEVERQHKEYPIDPELIWRFVQEIQALIDATWYNPDETLRRGTFV